MGTASTFHFRCFDSLGDWNDIVSERPAICNHRRVIAIDKGQACIQMKYSWIESK